MMRREPIAGPAVAAVTQPGPTAPAWAAVGCQGGDATWLGPQAALLHGFALAAAPALLAGIERVLAGAPFRHMTTPGGATMSVALTNCGSLGWTSDRQGYRYTRHDPGTGRSWPAMPPGLAALAGEAAACVGFPDFVPDACLINRYLPGSRLSLHQDRDERDFDAPIVSVSLGLTATFLFGGKTRGERPERIRLLHGDVVVWGGVDRLRYHGVAPLRLPLPLPRKSAPELMALGPKALGPKAPDRTAPDFLAAELPEALRGQRINLTLRKAG